MKSVWKKHSIWWRLDVVKNRRRATRYISIASCAVSACLMMIASSATATTTIWTGSSAGGVFNDDANWSSASPGDNGPAPDGPNDLGIFNADTNVDGTITFDADATHNRTFVQNTAGTIAFDTGIYTWFMTDFMLVGSGTPNTPTIRLIGGEFDFDRILHGTEATGPGPSIEVTGANTHLNTRRGSGGYSIGVPADGATVLVHNGASMTGDGQTIIGLTGSSNSSLTIDGVGSTLNIGNYLGVGHTGGALNATGNQASIINGATGTASHTLMGITAGATDNTLLVSGTGSTLTFTGVNGNDGGESAIGRVGINNLLQIDSGGAVNGTNVFVLGLDAASTGNQILIDDGSLTGTGIDIRQGNVTVTNGSVELSQFFEEGGGVFEGGGIIANNGAASFVFNSGTVGSVNADIANGSAFTVGDGGGSSATYNMKKDVDGNNGAHSFADGLSLSSNAILSGNGDVVGDVSGAAGAQVDVGASPGLINVAGEWNNMDLAIGLEIDDLSVLPALGGKGFDLLDIAGAFTHGGSIAIDVSEFVAGSNFVKDLKVVGWTSELGSTAATSVSFVGGPALPFEFRSDGLYLTDVSINIIPEPATLMMVVVALSLCGARRRRQSMLTC